MFTLFIKSKHRILLNHNYSFLLLGWLTSRIIFSFFRNLEISQFVILPGFIIGYLFLLKCFNDIKNKKMKYDLSYFMIGILTDSILYWIIRPGTNSAVYVSGPWNRIVVFGSLLSLAIIISFIFLCRKIGEKRHVYWNQIKRINIWLTIIGAIGSIVFYRVIYLLTIEIPNEERSLIILGSEIHHSILGIILLIIINILIITNCISNNLFIFLLYGIASGFIIFLAFRYRNS